MVVTVLAPHAGRRCGSHGAGHPHRGHFSRTAANLQHLRPPACLPPCPAHLDCVAAMTRRLPMLSRKQMTREPRTPAAGRARGQRQGWAIRAAPHGTAPAAADRSGAHRHSPVQSDAFNKHTSTFSTIKLPLPRFVGCHPLPQPTPICTACCQPLPPPPTHPLPLQPTHPGNR